MDYRGIRIVQKPNFEYIQEIDSTWYYLDECLRYSQPYESYENARDGLLEYYKEYKHETKSSRAA